MSAVVISISAGDRAALLRRRDALIESHLDLARSIATALSGSLPRCFDLDDLIQSANLGLLHAATRYRESLGVPFSAYARPVIRGAVLDSVRRGKWIEATRPGLECISEPAQTPEYEAHIDASRQCDEVQHAVRRLRPRLRRVVRMHYRDEMRLPAVADRLGVGKSRASQLHMEAVRALREELAV